MKSSYSNDKEVFEQFIRHEGLRRLRSSFDELLGHPVWRICSKPGDSAHFINQHLSLSYEIWHDPRVKKFHDSLRIFKILQKHRNQPQPHFFEEPRGKLHYCVPVCIENRLMAYLLLSGLRRGSSPAVLNLLNTYLKTLTESCCKTEELGRLSAAIRPRAIALSTVHTVHRIINSTLNLDELVSRLAHLTAQVLRVERCVIYLVEDLPGGKQRSAQGLIRKAMLGYPKNREKKLRLGMGQDTEGRVAKTAEILLRKKFISVPMIDEDVMGVVTVIGKKDKKDFNHFDLEILTTLAEEAVIAIKNAQLYEEQRQVTLGTIQSLAVVLGMRVPQNTIAPDIVLRLALGVADELKLNDEEKQALHYATLLKDTAKIGIPEEILKKTEKLTGEELNLIREHPIKGAKIVQSFENLRFVAPIILYSREKFDGTGYPEGLRGDQIPIGAKILSVLNAFEAIISGRPYREESSVADALTEILRNSGTQFDPKVVDAFVRVAQKEGINRAIRTHQKNRK